MYGEKLLTSDEIAEQITSNTVCSSPNAAGEPFSIPRSIAKRALEQKLKGIRQVSILSIVNDVLWNDINLDGIFNHSTFYCGTDVVRNGVYDKRIEYIPSSYSQMPNVYENQVKPDVFYATVSPMDEHGYFSFGTSGDCSMTLKRIASKVFLEVNKYMPRTMGDCFIHISEVDAICEYNRLLPELLSKEVTDKDKAIGNYVAELVPNSATIQLGIGSIPNAVASALVNKHNLGVHSELFTESMVDLIELGVIDNNKKNIHKGKCIATFALGTKRMYDFINNNIGVEFHPVEYVNNPHIIGKNDNLISINSCIEVDLIGQVCSEAIGTKQYTGAGGQVDFVRGAYESKGGMSIIALHSSAKNISLSKIKSKFDKGSIITTSYNDVDYIVTEYGIAKLRGKSVSDRVKSLINISHPYFKDELLFEAKRMGFI